ncbi:MAG: hypothetical protein J4N80_09955 [Chloroflexi bacterium]|nr:hypothetical protein [Chloroflexota bacterium]
MAAWSAIRIPFSCKPYQRTEAYMQRYELSTSQWSRIEEFLPGRSGTVGVTGKGQPQLRERRSVGAA